MTDKAITTIIDSISLIGSNMTMPEWDAFSYARGAIDLALATGLINPDLALFFKEIADTKKKG